MERKRPRFDNSTMVSATHRAKSYIEDAIKRAENIDYDKQIVERTKLGECKACFYVLGRIGGAAMTTQPCACCGKDQLYGSTCTDVLCLECAKEHELCKHCGGDIDIRVRRRKWPEPVMEWIESEKTDDTK